MPERCQRGRFCQRIASLIGLRQAWLMTNDLFHDFGTRKTLALVSVPDPKRMPAFGIKRTLASVLKRPVRTQRTTVRISQIEANQGPGSVSLQNTIASISRLNFVGLADSSEIMSDQAEQSAAERRRERQRLHIIAQAEQLYVENGGDNGGFENTTVEAIAERSDISLRTFFRYFESKQDVIYLDSAQALLDLEKFTRARLESETPAQAALNGRLDQIRHFCSSKASRARMRRSLRSPEFRDGLNKMRGKIEAKIATLLAPHFEGSPAERNAQARMTASLTTTLVAPMLTPEKLKASTDFDAEIAASRANLERLLGQMSLNKK